MRGRIPKPTALKILDGTQPCRINRDEPRIPPANLVAPSWLDMRGNNHYAELAPILIKAGLLTEADRHSLALLCDAFSRFQADPTDNQARDLYRRMSQEFGLTPGSRTRIKSTAEKPVDALTEFLNRAKGRKPS